MFKLDDLLRVYRSDDEDGGAPAEEAPVAEEQEQEQQEQQQQQEPHWAEKRLSQMAAKRRAAEERAAQLEAEIAELRQQPVQQGIPQGDYAALTPSQIDELAAIKAQSIVKQREQEWAQQRAQTELQKRLNEVDKEANEKFGDAYAQSVQRLQNAELGGELFVHTLLRNKNAAAILTFLGQPENLDTAARLHELDPVDMAFELAEIAPKAVKHFSQQKSKAPPPIEGVGGTRSGASGKEPAPSDPAWFEWRKKQLAERNAGKRR